MPLRHRRPSYGELRDFEHVPGDPSPEEQQSNAQQWGRRILLSANNFLPNNPNPTSKATVIQTSDLGKSFPINVQLRFAQADSNGNPIMRPPGPGGSFTPAWPPSLNTGNNLIVTVRRGTDPIAPVAIDTYRLDADASGTAGQVLPFDIVTTRNLGIDVEFESLGGLPTGVWVEAVATVVTQVSRQNQIFGWDTVTIQGIIAPAITPANVELLPAHADRQQFVIVNMATNADLIVCFGPGANWGPPNVVGSIILPRNTFATYESPIGGYRGLVTGSWTAGADNGALVTEGTLF